MKDEIKNILKCLEMDMLDNKQIEKLLDYITNLQEENERLKETTENLTTMTVNGDRTQIKNTAQYKLDIYKSRNEKAIEYINNNIEDEYEYHGLLYKNEEKQKLLNILNGDDE